MTPDIFIVTDNGLHAESIIVNNALPYTPPGQLDTAAAVIFTFWVWEAKEDHLPLKSSFVNERNVKARSILCVRTWSQYFGE